MGRQLKYCIWTASISPKTNPSDSKYGELMLNKDHEHGGRAMLLECVPNFSEGRDRLVIEKIAAAIRAVKEVRLLGVDSGAAANRTVMTFAGPSRAVVEAAFNAIQCAARHIDMRLHHGAHPRMGATDVCPLIPLAGANDEAVIPLARELAKRVGESLQIPIILYERAASAPHRRDLAAIRRGDLEAMQEKLKDPVWKPDFGPNQPSPRSGVTAVGVRGLMIAYNVNLKGNAVRQAKAIARRVRASGGIANKTGLQPAFPGLKAIGWYLTDRGRAQVSMNITRPQETPIQLIFETIKRLAEEMGGGVSGSELVGLIPKKPLLDAGRFYLPRQGLPGETALVQKAAAELGLAELKPFYPAEHVLEYALGLERSLL